MSNTDTPGAVTHSPTAWAYDDSEGNIYAPDGNEDTDFVAMLAGPSKLCDANGRYIVDCVNAHDRLTAERDWYRAALHGIAHGHAVDPAAHASDALAWVGDDGESAPADLVRVNAALVEALEQTNIDVLKLLEVTNTSADAMKCFVECNVRDAMLVSLEYQFELFQEVLKANNAALALAKGGKE